MTLLRRIHLPGKKIGKNQHGFLCVLGLLVCCYILLYGNRNAKKTLLCKKKCIKKKTECWNFFPISTVKKYLRIRFCHRIIGAKIQNVPGETGKTFAN